MENDLCFLSTLSSALLLVMFVHPNLNTFLKFFLSFFFLFLLRLSAFKPLNGLYSKFEQLKMSGRASAGMKSGLPDWGISLN